MAENKKVVQINSVLGGWSNSDFINSEGYFLSSVGIDPDMPATDSGSKPCSFLRPTVMAKFSGSEVTGVPMWFIPNTKNANTYLYANDGKIHTIASDLSMGTALNSGNALSSASGNGGEYYDNNVYFATDTDITQYGQLNDTPTLDQTFWTSTLGLTALSNKTYPSINGVPIPNHVMHRHTDDKLYIADVLSSGKGALHYIKTKKSSTQGDTDDGSTYNALDFDYDEWPVAIETYHEDLVIALIKGTSTSIIQSPAKIAFWDTTSESFSSITSVELKDPLITAIKNVGGIVYVFSGFAGGGCRISQLVSSYRIKELMYLPDVYPPLPGAVDDFLNRFVWGTNTVEPEVSGSVFSYGAKSRTLRMNVQNILRSTASGANPMVTAVKYVDSSNGAIVQPIIGWKDDSNYGLDKISSSNYGDNNAWRSDVFIVGTRFKVNRVRIPLVQTIATNRKLRVKIVGDSGYVVSNTTDDTQILADGNSEHNGRRYVEFYPRQEYENNFFIQLEWEGSELLTVALPIIMELNILS